MVQNRFVKGSEMRIFILSFILTWATLSAKAAPIMVSYSANYDEFQKVYWSSLPERAISGQSDLPVNRIPDYYLRNYKTVIIEFYSHLGVDTQIYNGSGNISADFLYGLGSLSDPVLSTHLSIPSLQVGCKPTATDYCIETKIQSKSDVQRLSMSSHEWRLLNPRTVFFDSSVQLELEESTGPNPYLIGESWSITTIIINVDDFSPVPLPAGLPLALTALGGLALFARRRRLQ